MTRAVANIKMGLILEQDIIIRQEDVARVFVNTFFTLAVFQAPHAIIDFFLIYEKVLYS